MPTLVPVERVGWVGEEVGAGAGEEVGVGAGVGVRGGTPGVKGSVARTDRSEACQRTCIAYA
jgi:hypothetical protein